jgi:uncharacterized membrane protein YqjE
LERLKSLGNGLIIIILLLVTAVVAVIWPLIAQSLNFAGFGSLFGGATRPPISPALIVITIPEPIASMVGTNELVLQGFIAFATLAAIVIGSVVAVGLGITILMRLGGKFTSKVAEDKEYQQHVAALEAKEKETLKAKREKNPEPRQPEGHVYGLDTISYSLLVLFFVTVFAVLVYVLAAPSGEFNLFGQTFNSMLPILVVLFIITIPLLAWRVRQSRLDAIADSDNNPIPWDTIAVWVLGLLVVGIGIGLMLYINSPAFEFG